MTNNIVTIDCFSSEKSAVECNVITECILSAMKLIVAVYQILVAKGLGANILFCCLIFWGHKEFLEAICAL